MRRSLFTFVVVTLAGPAFAQESAVDQLLRRSPEGFGVVLAVHDLRGNYAKVREAPWFRKLLANPLVESLLASPELRELERLEEEVRKIVDFDLAKIRDDVFGEGLVFAFRPKKDGAEERGALLVQARSAEALASFVDKMNELQTNVGDLTSLEPRKHGNQDYYRRVTQNSTQFYWRSGATLAFSTSEETLLAIIDRAKDAPSPALAHRTKAGLAKAAVSLWFDPRAFDAELEQNTSKKLGAQGVILENLLTFWKGLDGILISGHADDGIEARITLVAKSGNDARKWLSSSRQPSDLWRRLPEDAFFASAFQLDSVTVARQILDFAPAKDRKNLEDFAKKNLGASTGLDVFGDILPNLGPDVGFAVFPPSDAKEPLPQALFALRVQPEPKASPVDQTLFRAIQMFAGWAVFDYNRRNDTPLKISAPAVAGAEIKSLQHPKLFPPGWQPSLALKDGYLLMATSPEAVARFGRTLAPAPAEGAIPLAKLAPGGLAKFVRERRAFVIDQWVSSGKETPASAARIVDGVTDGLELFRSLQLTQRTAEGIASWSLHLAPAKD